MRKVLQRLWNYLTVKRLTGWVHLFFWLVKLAKALKG